jgi:citrate/tricarballylate utilization protein
MVAALTLFLVLGVAAKGQPVARAAGGQLLRRLPAQPDGHLFAPIFLFAVLALGIGVARFWRVRRAGCPRSRARPRPRPRTTCCAEVPRRRPRRGLPQRERPLDPPGAGFHHATFYGFMLCFASTSVATLYHYVFGWQAPYAFTSLPVILGTVGGIGLLVGPAGLFWLNLKRHPQHGDAAQKPMDRAFIGCCSPSAPPGWC